MDINHSLKQGWDIFTKDWLILILGALITAVLTLITLGVLGGPLMAGFFSMVLGQSRDGRPADLNELFRHFDRFGDYLLAFYVLFLGISLGIALLIIPGVYLASIWFYVFPLMVDKKLSFSEALRQSSKIVNQDGLLPHAGLVVLLGALQVILSNISHGLATIVATPFSTCCIIAAYLQITDRSK